jgi:hypothetical protein
MWVIALEALVAFCLLLLIVWLTMGKAGDRTNGKDNPGAPRSKPGSREE